MNPIELLPKHIDDLLVAYQLKDYTYTEIRPIISELKWLQDKK